MARLPRSRRMIIEAIEPRLMFSATADIAIFHDNTSELHLANAADQVDLIQVYDIPDQPIIIATDTPDDIPSTRPASSLPSQATVNSEASGPVIDDLAIQSAESEVPDSPGLTTTTEPTTPIVETIDTGLVAMAKADSQELANLTDDIQGQLYLSLSIPP